MSYRLPIFLTLPLLLLAGGHLAAQQQEFRSAYYRLASPTAVERDAAIAELVGLEGDIGALARAAFKNARVAQRCALFEVDRKSVV